jgi:hypothetical protein
MLEFLCVFNLVDCIRNLFLVYVVYKIRRWYNRVFTIENEEDY